MGDRAKSGGREWSLADGGCLGGGRCFSELRGLLTCQEANGQIIREVLHTVSPLMFFHFAWRKARYAHVS